MTKIKLNS